MIRVVIADDHHLVREGIRALLERAGDIQVTGEAEDGSELLELLNQAAPDVVILDIAMPRMNGMEALARLVKLHPTVRTVILSMYSDETLVRQALRYGARGFLIKRSVSEELLLAVRSAARGEIYLSPAVSAAVLQDFMSGGGAAAGEQVGEQLSPREREVLQLVCEGRSNPEVARLLNLSIKTVEKHRTSLMAKMQVHDLASLIRKAIKNHLIFLE